MRATTYPLPLRRARPEWSAGGHHARDLCAGAFRRLAARLRQPADDRGRDRSGMAPSWAEQAPASMTAYTPLAVTDSVVAGNLLDGNDEATVAVIRLRAWSGPP